MKGIVRKTWKVIEFDGVPNDEGTAFSLIDRKTGDVYGEKDVLTDGITVKKFNGSLYAVKESNGVVKVFAGKPRKSVLSNKWRGTCLAEFPAGIGKDYILSSDNAQPVQCSMNLVIKTDLYRPHKKKQ